MNGKAMVLVSYCEDSLKEEASDLIVLPFYCREQCKYELKKVQPLTFKI